MITRMIGRADNGLHAQDRPSSVGGRHFFFPIAPGCGYGAGPSRRCR